MMNLLPVPGIQIVAVCDPSRDAVGYLEIDGLRVRRHCVPARSCNTIPKA